MTVALPKIHLISTPDWKDYELLDSGDGVKLERFGPYTFIKPEHQAVWNKQLPEKEWEKAHACYISASEEEAGQWRMRKTINPSWIMSYKDIKFFARLDRSRHLGVFPEQAANWDWISRQVKACPFRPAVLNLFGYTGIASIAAARAGATVVHVDASKKTIKNAQENSQLAGSGEITIRWIVDDALKFVQREIRRGKKYHGIILDPPKFGRGPKGEVWEFFELLPKLLEYCRLILDPQARFIILTAYAIRASCLTIHYVVSEATRLLGTVKW
jgi:23S rRNA (cytosine1962-C5)-methyltransferase